MRARRALRWAGAAAAAPRAAEPPMEGREVAARLHVSAAGWRGRSRRRSTAPAAAAARSDPR
eukprot:6980955-Prymnesium_polylepis.1